MSVVEDEDGLPAATANAAGRTPTRRQDPAELVISPRLLLPVAPENMVASGVSVAVRGTDIVEVGPTPGVLERHSGARRLALDRHVLLPGLVNAHSHLAMSLLRGLGESLPLDAWLEETIWPLEGRWVDADFVRDGTTLAVAEMIAAGTTTAADMYFFPETAAEVCRDAGLRLQAAFPITTVANAYSKDVDDCFAKGLALHDRFRNDELVSTCFGPHSAYALERRHLERIAHARQRAGRRRPHPPARNRRRSGGRQARRRHYLAAAARRHWPGQREPAGGTHDGHHGSGTSRCLRNAACA